MVVTPGDTVFALSVGCMEAMTLLDPRAAIAIPTGIRNAFFFCMVFSLKESTKIRLYAKAFQKAIVTFLGPDTINV
jgi:hypothetical protein